MAKQLILYYNIMISFISPLKNIEDLLIFCFSFVGMKFYTWEQELTPNWSETNTKGGNFIISK